LWGNLVKWVYTGKEQEITFNNAGTYILGVFASSSTTGNEYQLKNLMIRKKEIEDSSYVKYEKNSALIDMNKDNKFDEELEIGNIDNGINLNATNTYRSKNYLKIKPNTIYSFYLNKKLHRVLISFYDKDKNYINTSAVGLETKGIINSMSNAEFLRFRCYGDDKSLFENSLIEIYEGIDRYYEFAQIDEVKDIFDNGKLTKNIEKYVVSSNVIGIQDTYTNVTYATIPKPINSANYGNYSNTSVLFTHATFKVKTWSSWDTLEMIGVISSNASSNEYWIGFPKGTTLDEMKTKLDDAVLYYRLKESQIYELPYERLKLHKGYNYITLNDELYSNMEIEYLTDSSLNAQYAKKSELEMTEESIRLDLSKKVSTDNFKTTIEEVNNTFEQKITDSEASTESLITRTKDDAIKTSKDYTDNKVKDRPTATEMTNQIKQSITDSENKTTSSLTSTFNNKLKDYSTTTQMNNAITQSQEATENKIAMEVSNTYETKEGATTKANNAKNEAIKNVDAKLELKVGNNEYNKIVSMLNASADEITLAGGTKIHLKTAGKLIIDAGNFKLDEKGSMIAVNGTFTGTINATSGKVGQWIIDKGGNMYCDVGNYRTYIQGAIDGGGNTWVFSAQEKNSEGGYDKRFVVYANGKVDIMTPSNLHAFLSVGCENRKGGAVRFMLNTAGHYGIYDEAWSNWREYFSNDGSSNKWILPAFDGISLDYFFTSENVFMFRPSANNSTHLGGSKWRWMQLWAVNATSTSSDEKEKRDMLEFIDKDNEFFDKLKPISFYRKKGDRRHFGFGAQTVEKALKEVGYTSEDFAGLCFDKKTKTVINEEGKEVEEPVLDENGNVELMYSLRYEEFISLNTWQIQLAKKRISNLEDTVKKQQETIDMLIKRIEKIEEGGSN